MFLVNSIVPVGIRVGARRKAVRVTTSITERSHINPAKRTVSDAAVLLWAWNHIAWVSLATYNTSAANNQAHNGGKSRNLVHKAFVNVAHDLKRKRTQVHGKSFLERRGKWMVLE